MRPRGGFADVGLSPASSDESSAFLKGVFKDRLVSTLRMRETLEKLVREVKTEEQTFREYIQTSLAGSAASRDPMSDDISMVSHRLSEIESKYEEEISRRLKIQQAFTAFRDEGNEIINRLRFALKQITQKYKDEVVKNRVLSREMNDQLIDVASGSDDVRVHRLKEVLQITNGELQKYKMQFGRIENKFVSYKKMVVDHKKVIDSLKKRNGRLAEENEAFRRHLTILLEARTEGPTNPDELLDLHRKETSHEDASPDELLLHSNPLEDPLSLSIRLEDESDEESHSTYVALMKKYFGDSVAPEIIIYYIIIILLYHNKNTTSSSSHSLVPINDLIHNLPAHDRIKHKMTKKISIAEKKKILTATMEICTSQNMQSTIVRETNWTTIGEINNKKSGQPENCDSEEPGIEKEHRQQNPKQQPKVERSRGQESRGSANRQPNSEFGPSK